MASLWTRLLIVVSVSACLAPTFARTPKHVSSRTTDLSVIPENITNRLDTTLDGTSRALPDPYIWHADNMVSTWTFRDFRGQIPLKACQANWQWVERLAATKISLGQGDSSVTQWPLMWKRTITSSREDAGQWFDLTIEASWRLTWRMLDEALDIRFPPEGPRGAYLACETTKDFRFDVRAAGKVVASGSIIRRGDSLTEKRTLKRISIRDQETRIPVNATAADSSTNLTVGPAVRDPYVWHRAEMISTWEFHSFRGRIDADTAQINWYIIFHHAADNVLRGKGNSNIRRLSRRPLVFSWKALGSDVYVDTVIYPQSGFTYRVLMESLYESDDLPRRMRGAPLACERRQEFYFDVWVGAQHVGWGSTRTRYPDTAVS